MAEISELENRLLQERRIRAEALVERHSGNYITTEPPENHLLPYEVELRNHGQEWFYTLNKCDFLYVQKSGSPQVELDKKALKSACEYFFQNTYNGFDYYSSAIKTLRKHIKKITGQDLSDWFKGEFSQDAIKTVYLLYQLHICTPSGIEMLANEKDSRFVSVELFSSRHQPLDGKGKVEDDHVILLSSWLKEFFIKTTFHCDLKFRSVLKNLDMILSGYLRLYSYIQQEPEGKFRTDLINYLFPKEIRTRDYPAKESLSVSLMRAWQLQRSVINSKSIDALTITGPLTLAIDNHIFKEHSLPLLNKKEIETIRTGAAFLTYYTYAKRYRGLTHILNNTEFEVFVEEIRNLENKIFEILASDTANKIKVVEKGISKNNRQTSLLHTLKKYSEQNKDIIKTNWGEEKGVTPQINLDNGCDTHLLYFELRIHHATNTPNLTGEDYLNKINQDRKNRENFNTMARMYISRLSVPEIYADIERVNKIMSRYINGVYNILPHASDYK